MTASSELTEMQQAFVEHYVSNGANGAQAAIAAGYSEAGARGAAYKLINLPHVQAAITARLRRDMGDLMVIGVSRLKLILLDPETKPGTVVDAVIKLGDRVGLGPKSDTDTLKNSKPIEQMTMAELYAFIQWREAKICDITPQASALPAPASA